MMHGSGSNGKHAARNGAEKTESSSVLPFGEDKIQKAVAATKTKGRVVGCVDDEQAAGNGSLSSAA